MNIKILSLTLVAASFILSPALRAGTPEQEKAFVEKFKTAYEANDTKTLESFLYTEGANPMALEFYKMMLANSSNGKISKIELVNLTPDEAKKAEGVQAGPDGMKSKMPLKPTKKLKMSVETKDDNGSSSSSSENFIAQKDGKYVIPVPATVK